MAKGHKPAGGIRSRNVTERPVKYGQPAKEKLVRGVSQIGSSLGDHATERAAKLTKAIEPVRGGPLTGAINVKLGNEVARNVGGGGPGTGRVTMRSGSQQQWGAAAPGNAPAKNTDILNQFGPDSAGVRGRR
jgi:hypothetical protein